MTVDAAAAGSQAGLLDPTTGAFPTGAVPVDTLPTEQFGAPTPEATPGRDVLGSSPTALDQYQQQLKAEQDAQYMASLQPQTVGGLPVNTGTGKGAAIVAAAEKYLGVAYQWGGEGPRGVDCSGLVALAYKAAGINLPRVSFQQARTGSRVSSMKDLRPGDIVAWDNSPRNPGADHIAIYLGGGKIIEAPHPGAFVRVRTLSPGEGAWYVRMGW